MSTLAIRLLGPPRIERDGRAITFDTRKAVALLAYLAECRSPVRRETLARLLWPDYPAARASANLRRTLWSAQRALGAGHLAATPTEVELVSAGDLWVDLERFRQLVGACGTHSHPGDQVRPGCLTLLTEAVELVRGPFLEGFTLADSAEFDDWQALQAAALGQLYADALGRLSEGWIAQGELWRALDLAQRLADLDPLHEPAQRRLMLLYAWTGQHVQALRRYRELERQLARELGAPPEPETAAIFAAIRARQEPPPPHAAVSPPAPIPVDLLTRAIPSAARSPAPVDRRHDLGYRAPAGATPGRPPALVAREAELARLDAQLRAALAGQARVVFVVGDSGSGKTALLEELARRAQSAHPALVAALGTCNAYIGAGDPYLPFRQILELLAGDPDALRLPADVYSAQADSIGRLIPATAQALVAVGQDLLGTMLPAHSLLARAAAAAEPGAAWPEQLRRLAARETLPADPTLQQSSLFEQYARVLRAVARVQPLLLLLDDLQWADLSSINLLLHLGRSLGDQPALIVGAYRSDEVAAERKGERHPLAPVVHELQRLYGEPAIDLGAVQGRRFVDALLDRQPNLLDERFRATLCHQTGGHALFTVELLRGMHERGDLSYDGAGRLVARPALDWDRLPARVDAVIAERVGRLETLDRELLRVASVEGEEFSAEVTAHLLGVDEREVLGRLSAHLDRGHHLVRASGTRLVSGRRLSRYRFRHFLIRRYVYGSLDAAERAYWNERMCDALEALYGEQAAAVQLAHHAQEAGRIDLAIRFLQQAGDNALRLSANDEAAGHYRHALAQLAHLPHTDARDLQELGLQIALSKPLQLTMGYPAAEVERAFERAMGLGRALGSPPELVPLLGRYAHFLATRGEHRRARAVVAELMSLARQAEDEALLLEAFAAEGISAFYLGDHAAARGWLTRAGDLGAGPFRGTLTYAYGIEPGVHIGVYAMLAHWFLGEPEQAADRQEALLAGARASEHPHTLAFALAFAAILDCLAQDVPATLSRTEAAIALSAEHGFRLMHALALTLRSWAVSAAGAPEEGLAMNRTARAAAEQMHVLALMPYLVSLQADILQRCGRRDEAIAALEEALALAEQTGEGAFLPAIRRVAAGLQRAAGASSA